jgi:hypothetical protein
VRRRLGEGERERERESRRREAEGIGGKFASAANPLRDRSSWIISDFIRERLVAASGEAWVGARPWTRGWQSRACVRLSRPAQIIARAALNTLSHLSSTASNNSTREKVTVPRAALVSRA